MEFKYCPYSHNEELKALSRKLWQTSDNYPIEPFENTMQNRFVDAETQARWEEWIEEVTEVLATQAA